MPYFRRRTMQIAPFWHPRHTRLYISWLVLLLVTCSPLVLPSLSPLWRVLCWIGPTALALDVDAGNHRCIYIAKLIIWILTSAFTLSILQNSKGFTRSDHLVNGAWAVPAGVVLIITSCIVTLIGHHKRRTIWHGSRRLLSHETMRTVDGGRVYADFEKQLLRTRLLPKDLRGAWVMSHHGDRRKLTSDELHEFVLRTCFVTQFVMSRIFKSPNNKVFVYSLLTFYRTRLVMFGLLLVGFVHVGQGIFVDEVKRDAPGALLLWLTLPTITLPALVRMKFGPDAEIMLLMRGFLPAKMDKDMWQRMGVSAIDLYTALMNAPKAEMVLKSGVGLVNLVDRPGTGSIVVECPETARQLCLLALVGVGDRYVRVTDGKWFGICSPGQIVSADGMDARAGSENSNLQTKLRSPTESEAWEAWETPGGMIDGARKSWRWRKPFRGTPSAKVDTLLRHAAQAFATGEIELKEWRKMERVIGRLAPSDVTHLLSEIDSGGRVVSIVGDLARVQFERGKDGLERSEGHEGEARYGDVEGGFSS